RGERPHDRERGRHRPVPRPGVPPGAVRRARRGGGGRGRRLLWLRGHRRPPGPRPRARRRPRRAVRRLLVELGGRSFAAGREGTLAPRLIAPSDTALVIALRRGRAPRLIATPGYSVAAAGERRRR